MKALTTWDYVASVQKMRPLVVRWKTLTDEMLEELHQAREELSRKRDRMSESGRSWQQYLSDIGLARSTAHDWLKLYDPVEKKRIEPPPRKEPVKATRPIIDDQEYERRKIESLRQQEAAPSLDEVFEDVQNVLLRQEKEEVFRDFDLDGLISELRRRIVGIADPSRRHHAINQIIKAMRELAIECDRLSAGRG